MRPNSEDRLARSYFDEPLWPLERVLAWSRFRTIDLLTVSYDDIRSLHFQARMYKTSPRPSPLVTESPAVDLHKRLKEAKIEAIRPNGEIVSAVIWHKVSSNPRAWPEVWFRRQDVLRLYKELGSGEEPETVKVEASDVPPTAVYSTNERKRRAVAAAFENMGVASLAEMSQKEREGKVIEFVNRNAGLTVSDRFVRDRFRDAKERRRS